MFFFSDNPIALFLALVLIIVLLRIILGKHKWFSGKNSYALIPVLMFMAVILIGYKAILSVFSFAVPFIALLIVFLFALGGVYFMLGMPRASIAPSMNAVGTLKVGMIIAVICIFALAVSQVVGPKLLDDKSVSIGDVLMTQEEEVTVDFSPIFTKYALGLIFLIVVIGMVFVFVNMQS